MSRSSRYSGIGVSSLAGLARLAGISRPARASGISGAGRAERLVGHAELSGLEARAWGESSLYVSVLRST